MIFRQLFDLQSSTYTYLLACEETRQAILIDPVFEQCRRDLALIHELNLTLLMVVDTHCHADHVTSAWLLREQTGCKIASAAITGASDVDVPLRNGDVLHFGREYVVCHATPGHTDGCLTFVTADSTKAFTGDALLIRGCGRCDFQQGDAATLYRSIHQHIFSLPDDCELYPGHDYSGRTKTTVAEEKQHNARLGGGASVEDFVGYMDAMQLPHPKLIDHAVPANLKSGKPDQSPDMTDSNWAPIQYTFSGTPEVEVEWVISQREQLTVLDVRETSELESPVDRAVGTLVVPLSLLRGKLDEIPRDKPIVCLCRSGRRSAMAVDILKKAGVDKVANIAGGMLRWRELG